VALNLWFYLTPVLYPADIIPDKYRFIIDINPNAVFIHAYRRVIIHGDDPGLDRILGGLIISVVVFLVGYYAFKKMEPGFADSI
jgi:lipopolysaccharide transport system permease protein